MGRIITFLGSAGSARTLTAIATARWFAERGQRTLLVTHNPGARAEQWLGTPLGPQPQTIQPDLLAVQLQSTLLLEQVWQQLKQLLAQYLPGDLSEQIYPGELVMLPGFDSLLTFNALREYFTSGQFEVIIYDGDGDLETLRLLGVPEAMDWYFRRFRRLLEAFDIARFAASIGGPLASVLLSANVDSQKITNGLDQVRQWIDRGVAVVGDAEKLTAYLVTTGEPAAVDEARWLWGGAQQVNLVVSGVLVYPQADSPMINAPAEPEALDAAFAPLPMHPLPTLVGQDWSTLLAALPDFTVLPSVPSPFSFDLTQRQLKVFLPGFTKTQVKLTQFGPDLTIEAGDQRRNIPLPAELKNAPVKAGKFEEPYLLVSF